MRREIMAKYYVESGTLRMMVQADDVEKAALWAVHKALQQVLPFEEDESEEMSIADKQRRVVARGCMILGHSMRLSELGYGREDAARFATYDLVNEWSKLMLALARFEESLMTAV
jgi:hypothetical protein